MPRRCAAARWPDGTGRPRSRTSPPSRGSAPATTRPRVATPALSRPVTPTTSPGRTVRDTPDSRPAGEPEVRPVTVSTGVAEPEEAAAEAVPGVAAGGRGGPLARTPAPPRRAQ